MPVVHILALPRLVRDLIWPEPRRSSRHPRSLGEEEPIACAPPLCNDCPSPAWGPVVPPSPSPNDLMTRLCHICISCPSSRTEIPPEWTPTACCWVSSRIGTRVLAYIDLASSESSPTHLADLPNSVDPWKVPRHHLVRSCGAHVREPRRN